MNDSEAPVTPEPVRRLWDCAKKALAENDNPSPRDIDRLAASIGIKLAASTIEGWFKTYSVVPSWEKFEVLIKALGAEQDEDWRALHGAALTADRKRKKEERRQKELAGPTTPVPSNPDTDGEPAPQQLARDSAPATVLAGQSRDPAPTVSTDAVHSTAAKGGVTVGGRFWATPRKVAAAVVLLVFPAVLILVFWLTTSSGSSPSAPSDSRAPAAQPPDRYCAYVITEPAGVYPAPNISTKPIKFKHLNDRIEVLDRPRPSGWVVVSTPRDNPGFNWMQLDVLNTPTPCATPLPGQS